MEKILTCFCFTDIHHQQAMLDYPTTLRKSFVQANELAVQEFGLADIAIMYRIILIGINPAPCPRKTFWISRINSIAAFSKAQKMEKCSMLPVTTI